MVLSSNKPQHQLSTHKAKLERHILSIYGVIHILPPKQKNMLSEPKVALPMIVKYDL